MAPKDVTRARPGERRLPSTRVFERKNDYAVVDSAGNTVVIIPRNPSVEQRRYLRMAHEIAYAMSGPGGVSMFLTEATAHID